MGTIHTLLFILQVLVAVGLVGLILIQHGKGADAGAAFGSGSASTVFGSQGSSSFLTKVTAGFAFVFLANSLLIAYLTTVRVNHVPESLFEQTGVMQEQPAGDTRSQEDIQAQIEQQINDDDMTPSDVTTTTDATDTENATEIPNLPNMDVETPELPTVEAPDALDPNMPELPEK